MKNTTKTKFWAALWIIIGLVLLIVPFLLDYIIDSIGQPEWSNNIIILLINNIFPEHGKYIIKDLSQKKY